MVDIVLHNYILLKWFRFFLSACLIATLAVAQAAANYPISTKGIVPTSPLVRVSDGRMVAPEFARIIKRGNLVVALMENDSPPFVYKKDGHLEGVDIDLVKQVALELHVSIEYDRTSKTYDDVVRLVANGRADIGVSKLARTLERAQLVQFSAPYMRLEHSLLINRLGFSEMARDQTMPQAVRNFTGKLAVLADSAWEEFARRNFPKAQVVPYPTWIRAVAAVKSGEVVAAYRDAIEVRSVMKSDPSLALVLHTVSFTDIHSVLSVMVGSRDGMLLSFVNEIIANQPEQLTTSKLLKRMR
jgi:ABC-type amino acid transport substrate-binding protein